ncbi:MAG TPA: SRPBCC family protein [Bryobacteraceae bacterium]|nr:SRPBCC family protein [Bryobacteraceae bacterium]
MAVRIEKTFQVQEPIDQVWKLLSDPRNVAGCVPGARITEAVDERTFKGSVSVKVGPSVTDYKGEVRFERLDAAAHEMELVGKGQDVKGRGSASMKMTGRLRSLPDGGTEVATVAEVNVIGILAQFGGRMINDVSDVMFGEFTKRFQKRLQESAGAVKPAVAPAAGQDPVAPTPAAPVAVETTAPEQPPAEPVNAAAVFFAALRAAIRRFFHRLLGGSA